MSLQFSLPVLFLEDLLPSVSSSTDLDDLSPLIGGFDIGKDIDISEEGSMSFTSITPDEVREKWKGLNAYLEASLLPKSPNMNIVPFEEWNQPPGVLNPIQDDYILEEEKPLIVPQQENVIETLNKINMKDLRLSLAKVLDGSMNGSRTSKKGYQLPELKDIAKQLDIPITNQKKVVIAQRIHDMVSTVK
jgi:hypothetical protein